jgi:hypothetical protein
MSEFDPDEMVQFDGKSQSLLRVVHDIMKQPPERRAGVNVFRDGQPSVLGASEIEDIAKLPAFKDAPPRNAMTPILTPFLVRVRIADLNPPDQGAMSLYIAVCETEAQAMEATKRAVPSNWQVEAVVGEAEPALVQKINPQPFHPVPIA